MCMKCLSLDFHRKGIRQYVGFWDWLLSLSMVFPGRRGYSLCQCLVPFYGQIRVRWEGGTLFHPFVGGWICGWFPLFGDCEYAGFQKSPVARLFFKGVSATVCRGIGREVYICSWTQELKRD